MSRDVPRSQKPSERGELRAAEQLLPLVDAELRRLAAYRLSQERPGQTLQATSLVHEAWLRIAGWRDRQWHGKIHFFAASAEAMRRILVENARRKERLKHGGGCQRVEVDAVDLACPLPDNVRRHLNNEPVLARPPSKLYRFQKLVRRNKLAFAAGATIAAVLVVAFIVSSSQAVLAAVLLNGIGLSTWQALVATHTKAEALEAKTESVAAQKNAERDQEAEKSMHIEAEHQLYAAKMNLVEEYPAIGRVLAAFRPRCIQPLSQRLAGSRMLILTQAEKIIRADFSG